MKFLTALTAILFSSALLAQESSCTYTLNKKKVKIKWEAFKMPSKVGVGGRFKKIDYQGETTGKTFGEIVKGVKFTIDTNSVFTKDASRDKKIAKHVFSTMTGGAKIEGETVEFNEDTIVIAITMNGKTVKVPFSYSFARGNLQANAVVDVFDFAMNSQLAAITKACFEKHEGKTWNDVNVELIAQFKKKCK